MNRKEIISTITAILALIGFIFAAYFYIENRYALADELEKTKQRLEYKIKSDQYKAVQERIWVIEDRGGLNATAKEELRQLQESKEAIKRQLENMEKVKK